MSYEINGWIYEGEQMNYKELVAHIKTKDRLIKNINDALAFLRPSDFEYPREVLMNNRYQLCQERNKLLCEIHADEKETDVSFESCFPELAREMRLD